MLSVSSLNALHAYFNSSPPSNVVSSVPILRNTISLIFRPELSHVGFAYLNQPRHRLSLWFFNTIAKLIRGGWDFRGRQHRKAGHLRRS